MHLAKQHGAVCQYVILYGQSEQSTLEFKCVHRHLFLFGGLEFHHLLEGLGFLRVNGW